MFERMLWGDGEAESPHAVDSCVLPGAGRAPTRDAPQPAAVGTVEIVLAGLLRLLLAGDAPRPVQVGTPGRVRTSGDAPGWADAHPLAARLERMRPDGELVDLLCAVEAADLDDAALLEAAAGWERVMAWAAARQARVVTELHRRRDAERQSRFVGDEVAARLAMTRSAGDIKVGLAVGLDRLPAVADALDRGCIDARKAALLTEHVQHLTDEVARDVVGSMLVGAATLTPPQLRAALQRREIAQDPDGALQRHERARRDRHVTLTPTLDSMAWLTALLPADDAVAVFTTLTALADTAAPDDGRPMGARRADALVDLATRFLDAGECPDGPLPHRQRRRPHLDVTASVTTLLGLDDEPAHLSGYGPVPAPMARAIAGRATWRPLLVDAGTGELVARSSRTYRPGARLTGAVLDRDRTCTFPGCRIAAARCDLDHIEAFDPDRPPEGQTTASNLQTLCRHHHLMKTHGRWRPSRDPGDGITRWQGPSGHTFTRPPVPLPGSTPPLTKADEGRHREAAASRSASADPVANKAASRSASADSGANTAASRSASADPVANKAASAGTDPAEGSHPESSAESPPPY